MSTSSPRTALRIPFAVRAIAFGLLLAPVTTPSPAAEQISVIVDQAKLIKLPEKVATIVVGNPLIADVSLQPGGTMVVTGKGYGSTNVMALDRSGKVLMDTLVHVQGPRGVVVVYRGIERETYACAPNCERRITLGDGNTYFTQTLSQTATRSAAAQAAAAAK
jgi:Flp pilus assembly secretin CpaC